jgi:hypothetical protein
MIRANWPLGFDFKPKFYPARHFGKSFDEGSLNINPEAVRNQNIPAHFNVLSSGSTFVETEDRRTDAVDIFFPWQP